MSRLPYYLEGARWGYRLGNQELVDGMYRDGYFLSFGQDADGARPPRPRRAVQYKITREEQDRFALVSQQHAATAQSSGRFDAEIAPSRSKARREQPVFSRDGTPVSRRNAGEDGEVIAGVFQNRHDYCRELLRHHRWRGGGSAGGREIPPAKQSEAAGANSGREFRGRGPAPHGLGPFQPFASWNRNTGFKLNDFDLVELNEALRRPGAGLRSRTAFRSEKLNVNGGAIALGHPIGCTGTRITVTTCFTKYSNARRGAASPPLRQRRHGHGAGHRECS